jgi:hypothetical protein
MGGLVTENHIGTTVLAGSTAFWLVRAALLFGRLVRVCPGGLRTLLPHKCGDCLSNFSITLRPRLAVYPLLFEPAVPLN